MTRPRGFCSSCKNLHLVRDDGTIGRHMHMPTRSSDQLYCAGTGKPPIQDDRSEGTAMTAPDTTSTGCGRPTIEEMLREAVELLKQHVDSDPRDIDHNGDCRAHSWFHPSGSPCRQERTKRFLLEYDKGPTPTAQPPESHDNAGGPGALPATSADRPGEPQPTARFEPNPFRAGFERLAAEMDKVRTEARQRHAATIARMNRDRP